MTDLTDQELLEEVAARMGYRAAVAKPPMHPGERMCLDAILLLRQFLPWGRALQGHAQAELVRLFHDTQKFLDQFPQDEVKKTQ